MDMDRCISERFLLYPSFVSMHTAYSQTLFPITTGMLHISPSEELQPHGKSWSLNSRDVQCCLQRVVADTLLIAVSSWCQWLIRSSQKWFYTMES